MSRAEVPKSGADDGRRPSAAPRPASLQQKCRTSGLASRYDPSSENRKVGGSTPPLATESTQVRALMNVERPGSVTRASHNLSQTVLRAGWPAEDAVEGGHGGDGVGVLGVGVDPLGDHGVVAVDASDDVDRDPGV